MVIMSVHEYGNLHLNHGRDCVLLCTNPLEKGKNLSVLSLPIIGK